MMASYRKTSVPVIAACLLALVAHRLVLANWLGIAPDPAHLLGHWQHLALSDLTSDLFGSLMGLHSQPPLWNGLLGLAAGACDADPDCTAQIIHRAYFIATLILFVLLVKLTERLFRHRGLAVAVAFGFCLSPAVIYYENYVFYPHLTALLFTGFAFSLLRWIDTRRLAALIGIGLTLVALAWTWALFHPLLVAIALGGALLAARPISRGAIGIAVVSVLLSMGPALKNQMTHGQFAAGTWLGLNLAQVAPGDDLGCGFGDFLTQHDFSDTHLGTAFNDPRIVSFSNDCRDRAIERIIDNPVPYVVSSIRRTLSSMSLRPSDYIFDPLNWDRYPRLLSAWQVRDDSGTLRPLVVVSRLSVLAFNILLVGFMIWRAMRATDPIERRFLAIILVVFLLFLSLAHSLNGAEQERMRYTLHPILWVYGWWMVVAAIRTLRRRLRS